VLDHIIGPELGGAIQTGGVHPDTIGKSPYRGVAVG
jgi:hypothetical protein